MKCGVGSDHFIGAVSSRSCCAQISCLRNRVARSSVDIVVLICLHFSLGGLCDEKPKDHDVGIVLDHYTAVEAYIL